MELIWIPMLIVMLIFVGMGIGAGLFACGIAAVLVMVGVISSSAVLGLITQRPAVAVRAFLLQCGILAGIPAGAVAAWAGHEIIHGLITMQNAIPGGWNWQIPVMGGIGGGFGGAMLALVIDFFVRRSHAWLAARQNPKSGT